MSTLRVRPRVHVPALIGKYWHRGPTYRPFTHELPAHKRTITWDSSLAGLDSTSIRDTYQPTWSGYCGPNIYVTCEPSFNLITIYANGHIIGTILVSEEDVTQDATDSWSVGRPCMIINPGDDLVEASVDFVERLVTCLSEVPVFVPIGYRGSIKAWNGERIRGWWNYYHSTAWCATNNAPSSICNYETNCMCGYHIATDPWEVSPYISWDDDKNIRVFVVAPSNGATYVVHERGMRTERYDILACIAPLDAPAYEEEVRDPRFIRARNLPAKAWGIARELSTYANLV